MNPKPYATAWNSIISGLDTIFDIIKKCDLEGRVSTICQSLDDLTMAYTDVDSWMNVDVPGLDGLYEDPLQCIIGLIGEDVAAPPWMVEENSPLAEE